MFPVVPAPSYTRDLDCLQTRSRRPRAHPPNFALLCDWTVWDAGTVLGADEPPETIYVRSQEDSLRWFVDEVSPRLSSPFALVTGSHDRPMPMGWAAKTGFDWQQILDHPNLAGWFTENRDVADSRIHSFSLGIPCPDVASWIDGVATEATWGADQFEAARVWRRERKAASVFGCWHDRSGHVSGTSPAGADERSLCRAELAPEPFFTWVEPGLSRQQFLAELRTHAFAACPHGGGLDASPRAWEALHVGTIPIVRRSTTSAAFAGLPVVVVDDWSDITAAALGDWREQHRSAIESADLEHLLSNQALLDRVRATL